jgi:hypothetical protein
MTTRVRSMLLLAVLLIGILFVLWFRGFVAQDRCLDAGGRWNSGTRSCEGGAPHAQ